MFECVAAGFEGIVIPPVVVFTDVIHHLIRAFGCNPKGAASAVTNRFCRYTRCCRLSGKQGCKDN